jgi:rod shape-determining protein MreC
MRDFFYSLKFKILVGLFALLLGVVIYAAVNTSISTVPEKVLMAVTKPFSVTATAISNFMQGTIDKFVNADRYKLENATLRKQLNEMYTQIADKSDVDKENEQLKKMLKISEKKTEYVWAPPCAVVARNANDVFHGFTIDHGSDDGIAVGNPVFNEIGLIGVITEIAPSYAKVTTILSPELAIGVETLESKVIGIIENDIKYSAENKCRMSYIPKESAIKEGDAVMTADESLFPPGIYIGRVTDVFPDTNGLSLHALINPAVNLETVTDVFVITKY